jgi:predicted ester cyclase
MTARTNKEVVRAFYDAINRRDFGALSAYCHEDFVFYHQMDTPHPGVEGFIASEKKNFDAFADWQMPIRDIIAEGDKVAAYLVFEGTQVGEHQGIAPTGKRLRFSLLMLLILRAGKIIKRRAHFDRLDIRNQLAN